jgi:DNA-directed RNA polymerase specialized sigma24 family protein
MMVAEDQLEQLVAAAATEDEHAWQALWTEIEPQLSRIVAQPRFLGRLGQREDDRHNIVVAVMGRLRANRLDRLRLYLAAKHDNPRLRFMSWLRVVAKRVGIDYLRAHPEYVRRTREDASTPGRWIEPATLPPASQLAGERPPVTDHNTVRELLEIARTFPAAQRRALELWASSESFAAIAHALGMATPAEAERTVRSAIERLRRHHRELTR